METIKFNINGHILEFYRENSEDKFRFRIAGEPQLTEQLLLNCKRKKVKAKDLRYAVIGLTEKIINLKNLPQMIKTNASESDHISRLNEICQKKYGKNLTCELVSKTGADHCPRIKVRVTTPDGRSVVATGYNQRVARQEAAKRLLDMFYEVGQ